MSDKDERYTPREIFTGLKLHFDLDPCGAPRDESGESVSRLYVPADWFYTLEEDGLNDDWGGPESLVWMNCPWSGRHTQVPWIEKFLAHGNGVGIALAYTSSDWFQRLMPQMDGLCFPLGKTRYLKSDGKRDGNPPMGSVLFSRGELATTALKLSGLGMFFGNHEIHETHERREMAKQKQMTLGDASVFQEMAVPFETDDQANEALQGFWKELYELRCKYKLANVAVIVKDSVRSDEACFIWSGHCGNELEQESMAAWFLGHASSRRQEIIRNAVESGAVGSIKNAVNRK